MSSTKQNSAVHVTNSDSNYTNGHHRADSANSLRDSYEDIASLDINSYAKIMREHTLRQMEKARRMSRSKRNGDAAVAALGSETSIESTD